MSLTRFKPHKKPGTPDVPEPAIANAGVGTEIATINAILAVLRKYKLIET